MVTYNHARYVAKAIESALMQRTRFPIEIVIGEDGSTDGTGAIVESYQRAHPDRVRARVRERNVGVHRNALETLAACRGEFIAILEGDDYWTSPDKLQRQVDLLDAHPEASLSFHQALVVDEEGNGSRIVPDPRDGPFDLAALFRRNFVPTPSMVYRRAAFEGFPPWYPEIGAADWLLLILLGRRGTFAFIPEALCAHRQLRPGSWSAQSVVRRIEATAPMFRHLQDVLDPPYRALARRSHLRFRAWLLAERLTGGRFQRTYRRLRGRA